jgi:molybdopterin molybdotransferase
MPLPAHPPGHPLAHFLRDEDPEALPVSAAQALLRNLARPITRVERLPLMQSLGRILATDVVAPIDVPAYANSAMDGFAFDGAQLAVARAQNDILVMDVVGTALAGHPVQQHVEAGQCVRVMTGASIPPGTDTVVPHEFALPYAALQQGDAVRPRVSLSVATFARGANVRMAGEDLRQGNTILQAGRALRASDLGLLASLGIAEVQVFGRLRVAYFSTGDELRSIGQPLADGCVYDSNRYTLHAMLLGLGVEPIDFGVVRDDAIALRDVLESAAQQTDAIVSSGGVSAGDADFVRDVFASLGEVVFWKMAMRPGRPFAFGRLRARVSSDDEGKLDSGPSDDSPAKHALREVPFFGLPGNPVAVMASFYHLVRDALLIQMGATPEMVPRVSALAGEAIKKRSGRSEFARGNASRITSGSKSGQWQVVLSGAQGSGVLRSMSEANCFVILEHEQGNIAAGEAVDIMFFEALL